MSATATATPPTTISPDDLLGMGSRAKGFELVDGRLKELNVSTESSRVAMRVCYRLEQHNETHGLGWVFPPDTGFRCFADRGRVRKPDGAFISLVTLPPAAYEPDGWCVTVPDLILEVVSPNDLADEVDAKRDEWLAAGAKVVWVVFPVTRTAHVYRADGSSALLRAADTLTAPDLLPGFAVPVADLFRRPGEPVPSA